MTRLRRQGKRVQQLVWWLEDASRFSAKLAVKVVAKSARPALICECRRGPQKPQPPQLLRPTPGSARHHTLHLVLCVAPAFCGRQAPVRTARALAVRDWRERAEPTHPGGGCALQGWWRRAPCAPSRPAATP
jgi:hypothetical protein